MITYYLYFIIIVLFMSSKSALYFICFINACMGHSVVGTTLNLYSHMFQEARVRNCEAITNALRFTNEASTEENKSTEAKATCSDEDEDEQEEES